MLSKCETCRLLRPFVPMADRAEFAALRYFALGDTDHHTHAERNSAIAAYVRRRNTRAQPEVNFAVGSPIHTWTDHPVRAA